MTQISLLIGCTDQQNMLVKKLHRSTGSKVHSRYFLLTAHTHPILRNSIWSHNYRPPILSPLELPPIVETLIRLATDTAKNLNWNSWNYRCLILTCRYVAGESMGVFVQLIVHSVNFGPMRISLQLRHIITCTTRVENQFCEEIHSLLFWWAHIR